MRVLIGYRWPGNVRELKNCIEFAAVGARGSTIEPEDLPPELTVPDVTGSAPDEGEVIRAVLAYVGDNRKMAAEMLGISRATLYRRLEQLGLSQKSPDRLDDPVPSLRSGPGD